MTDKQSSDVKSKGGNPESPFPDLPWLTEWWLSENIEDKLYWLETRRLRLGSLFEDGGHFGQTFPEILRQTETGRKFLRKVLLKMEAAGRIDLPRGRNHYNSKDSKVLLPDWIAKLQKQPGRSVARSRINRFSYAMERIAKLASTAKPRSKLKKIWTLADKALTEHRTADETIRHSLELKNKFRYRPPVK
jgi:hypothetical protein